MAVSATSGNAKNSASASSLALAAISLTSGQTGVVFVVLGSTTVTVNAGGVTDDKSNVWVQKAFISGATTGVRVEIWTAAIGTTSSTTITIALSGSTSIAAGVEEYAGVTAIGNTSFLSGTDAHAFSYVTTQQAGSYACIAVGIATIGTSDSLTAVTGTERQKSIPTAASVVGGAIYDNTESIGVGQIPVWTKLKAAAQWAAVGIELEGGGASQTYQICRVTTAQMPGRLGGWASGGSHTFVV